VASSQKHTHIKVTVQKPYPIYDQNGKNRLKSIPCLWPKWLKNHTLWGRTYLYSSYKGIPPPSIRALEHPTRFIEISRIHLSLQGTCTLCYNLVIQALADRIQFTYCRNQCYLGHIDKLLYVSTGPFNFVPMSAVSNTVLAMSETSSFLSKREWLEEKVTYNKATRKRIIQTLNVPALGKKIVQKSYYLCTIIPSYMYI